MLKKIRVLFCIRFGILNELEKINIFWPLFEEMEYLLQNRRGTQISDVKTNIDIYKYLRYNNDTV